MKCIISTMNPATHSFAEAVLKEAGIEHFVMNYHSSIMDGSMAMIPRRLMVIDEDFEDARAALTEAGLGAEIEE